MGWDWSQWGAMAVDYVTYFRQSSRQQSIFRGSGRIPRPHEIFNRSDEFLVFSRLNRQCYASKDRIQEGILIRGLNSQPQPPLQWQ